MNGAGNGRVTVEGGAGASLLRDPLLYGAALIGPTLCSPFFRYLGWLGDEGVFLHAATRILDEPPVRVSCTDHD